MSYQTDKLAKKNSYEATVAANGIIIVKNVPLPVGDKVIVIIQQVKKESSLHSYSLRGKPYCFDHPLLPVADNDWEILE